jgi:two-component sensor histidine kinase
MTRLIPPNEAERLAAVRRYDILDTPPDGAFDRITRVAARLFDVPISIVSIVDEDRIWFKSHHGLQAEEIPRGPGLCASAILDNTPWVLTDAKVDPRALANPLVAGEFGLRFYAGIPLRTHDGFNLGTLCVIDHAPRAVSKADLAQLEDLAAIVMDEMELRLSAKRALADKEVLFKEVHHRVKNNLQIVSSLLALQSRSAPAELRVHFDEGLRRIHAIGLLHESFYREHRVESTDVTAYLGELLDRLIDAFGLKGRVSGRVEGTPVHVGLDIGTPLGLLAGEVISNACKHAFPGKRRGEIDVVLTEANGQVCLRIKDNGVGYAAKQERSVKGMGQRLIANLVQQLNGSARFEADDGTLFELSFPLRTPSSLPNQ